jgi:hypothetical protein
VAFLLEIAMTPYCTEQKKRMTIAEERKWLLEMARERQLKNRRMTLLRRDFRDPLFALLARERESCKSCIHAIIIFDRKSCTKGRKHGKRCKKYEEKLTQTNKNMI